MGERGIRYRFADFCRLPPSPVLLFFTIMVNNINNFGVINFYESNSDKAHSQSKHAEDIQPEPAQEVKTTPSSAMPFFVQQKLVELGTYTVEEFEKMYREAVKGGAPKLAPFLKHYRELAVFDFKGYNKKEIYESIKAFFGDDMDFGYTNFVAYY